MHNATILATVLCSIFLGPFLVDYAVTRYMRRRAHVRAIRQRLRDL